MRIITADLTYPQVQHILNCYPWDYITIDPVLTPVLACLLKDDNQGKLQQLVGLYRLSGCHLVVSTIYDSLGNPDTSYDLCWGMLEARASYEQLISESIDRGNHVWSEV